MQYQLNEQDKSLRPVQNINSQEPFFSVISAEQFREEKEHHPYHKELLHSLGSIRYCKAEAFKDTIIGTLRLPRKSEQRLPQISFAFCLTRQSLVFIEDTGDVRKWAEKQIGLFREVRSPAQLLLRFMEQMIEDDALYLTHIETAAEKMEESVLNGDTKDFFPLLTGYRQKLSELNAYYEQMTDIGELFQSHVCSSLIGDTQEWEQYTHRAERLQNHVRLLRENMLQLRELYQSKQDARQNKIMGILTIVTTIFLPLTLITGWYGMNFAYMPELKWRFGYPAVILVALIIAIGEIIYFKKKKFF
ncbi:MAG: CorA family divalent cation transporter [Acutalibacteraceae bacterium]|nr:CorA family divalent cation transporter [Oscillospiraceae bacterium]